MKSFAETYRRFSDDEIAALSAQTDTLTDRAREALAAEIQSRHLSSADLSKLNQGVLRQQAKFDRREKKRRKMAAEFLMPRDRIWVMAGMVGLLLLVWIVNQLFHHH